MTLSLVSAYGLRYEHFPSSILGVTQLGDAGINSPAQGSLAKIKDIEQQ